MVTNGESRNDINNKIGQLRLATHGAEVWELNKREKGRLFASKMQYWRRSSAISRLDHLRNYTNREMIGVRNIYEVWPSRMDERKLLGRTTMTMDLAREKKGR